MKITNKDFAQLRKLEESLWRPETRFDQEYMNRLLAPAFFEFGRSGRVYQRDESLAVSKEEINAKLHDFKGGMISRDVALVTYVSEVMYDELEVANRSSLWLKTPQGWQLQFHQGTAVR